MINNKGLTEKELYVLTGITTFTKEKGFSPTVRELCDILGYRSTATVHYYLKRLSEAGVISYEPTKPRTMVLHNCI